MSRVVYDYVTNLDQLGNAAGLLPRVDVGEDLGGVGGDATERDDDCHRVHDFIQMKDGRFRSYFS